MESEANIKCQGNECIAAAAKHVVFGLRVFEAAGDIHISEMPYTPEHFDLCGSHIERVRHHYVHVSEYELGGCPAHPRDKSVAINASS